jgi:uncharacterized protein (TIGR03000 family)
MYSIVLMAALTSGTDLPDFGRGCHGCRGGCWGGCYGGCYGGWGYGGWGGCYGGCYGGWGGCYGGWGGCYGGCYGGWGGCYGGGCGGYAWGGGYGGYVLASPSSYVPTYVVNGTTLNTTTSAYYSPAGQAVDRTRATIVVHLPADATLIVDGRPTQSRSATRTFTSPPLEAGKTYSYVFRAELNRDGERMAVDKTIRVRAGKTEEVSLDLRPAQSADRRQSLP